MNSIVRATSSGVPNRRNGYFAAICSSGAPSVMAVRIMPGCSELTRIPSPPSSSAAAFVKPAIACLDAV